MPPRKQKGRPSNPVDDRLLLQLWKALRIENPKLTKRRFALMAHKNYYQKSDLPNAVTCVDYLSIVTHLNRLLKRN